MFIGNYTATFIVPWQAHVVEGEIGRESKKSLSLFFRFVDIFYIKK